MLLFFVSLFYGIQSVIHFFILINPDHHNSWEPFFKGVYAGQKLPDWHRLWDDFIQEETQEDSKRNKQGISDENLALVSNTRKGKGKSSSKKGNGDGGSSQPRKKKDLSKIKCFSCHKKGNYAS
jgi:hypothetical protein